MLGLGQRHAFHRPLSVEEILVVTFTEAATAELRGRIRQNIHELRLACVRGSSGNPVLTALLQEIPDPADAAALLLAAERQMDEAAIFTIHGFCQRMLNLNAFESGMLFEQQLIEDESALRRQAAADFWRRHCYPLPLTIASYRAGVDRAGTAALNADARLHGESPALKYAPDGEETLAQRHEKIIARIDALKAQWRAAAPELRELIEKSGVDKRSYSSKHLPNWLDSIAVWVAEETQGYTVPKDWRAFVRACCWRKPKGRTAASCAVRRRRRFLAEPLSLRDLVIARALEEIRGDAP